MAFHHPPLSLLSDITCTMSARNPGHVCCILCMGGRHKGRYVHRSNPEHQQPALTRTKCHTLGVAWDYSLV